MTCEWEPAIKEASYDAEAAEDYNEDASSQQKVNVKKQVLQLKECLEVFTSVERLGADDAWYETALEIELAKLLNAALTGGGADIYKCFDQISLVLLGKILIQGGFPPSFGMHTALSI